jgi:hypothetical protein
MSPTNVNSLVGDVTIFILSFSFSFSLFIFFHFYSSLLLHHTLTTHNEIRDEGNTAKQSQNLSEQK